MGRIAIVCSCSTAFLLSLSVSSLDADRRGTGTDRTFSRFDRNGDGKVTPTEFSRPRLFRRMDRNGDGVLTLDEVRRRTERFPAASVSDAKLVRARDVPYGKHSAQRLDIYATEGVRAPVMVYVHGGGWRAGDKNRVGRKAMFFTGMDWVFVSINYRLLPDGKHPRNVQDVAAALAWVHEHIAKYGGNPGKLFLMGHSAGAHLAALVATDGRWLREVGQDLRIVRGVISLDTNGYDLPALMADGPARLYHQVFGEDPSVWRDASPIHHVEKGTGIPPFLLCYSRGLGRRINPTRKVRAEAFAKALRAAGIPADVIDAADRSHSEINARFGEPEDQRVTGRATAFLEGLLMRD